MRLRSNRRGFTLVEMLIVIGMISILMAIAVPTLSKLGMFGRDSLTVASSQVLYRLKAARIYAGSQNVDTAVVYAIGPHTDSRDGTVVAAMDGTMMVRRLSRDELDLLKARVQNMVTAGEITQADADDRFAFAEAGSEEAGLLPFIPVKTDGTFEPLARGAVIAPISNTGVIEDDYTAAWGPEDWGLLAIRVVDEQLNPVLPRTIAGTSPVQYYEYLPTSYDNLPGRFPAHVFKPSGVLETSSSEKARFVISIIPAPEEPQDVRFLEDGSPVTAETVEIYSTMGRIQASS